MRTDIEKKIKYLGGRVVSRKRPKTEAKPKTVQKKNLD
jgi:hypothetical protein